MFDIRQSRPLSKAATIIGGILLLFGIWEFFAVQQVDADRSIVTMEMIFFQILGSVIILVGGLFIDEKNNQRLQKKLNLKFNNLTTIIVFLLLVLLGFWLVSLAQPSYILY